MILWNCVERTDLYGKIYMASFGQAFCSAFVPGLVAADYTDAIKERFNMWKAVVENTLMQIAYKAPWYCTPTSELNQTVLMLTAGCDIVFYSGCVITADNLLGGMAIDHLFVCRKGESLVQCLVAFRPSGVHIERKLIESELDVWETMFKGLPV